MHKVFSLGAFAPFAPERFWEKVDTDGPLPESLPDLGPCWLWMAGKHARGYGVFSVCDADGLWGAALAHRVAWALAYGDIPAGRVIDHLCRVTTCVRPSHMEVVTQGVNALRADNPMAANAKKIVCVRGHNNWFIVRSTGWRQCRDCARIRDRLRGGGHARRRKKAEV